MIIFDRRANCFTTDKPQTGAVGQISFKRLIEVLEASGEVKSNEQITYLEFDEPYKGNTMIRYTVEPKV